MNIGKRNNIYNVAETYENLAIEDEEVAKKLKQNSEFRHSIYFYIQAMEKYIRSKIFTLVNPELEYYREKNKHHSIGNAIDFLIEIIRSDTQSQEQLKQQLNEYFVEDIKLNYYTII